jgi:hypothetical protein
MNAAEDHANRISAPHMLIPHNKVELSVALLKEEVLDRGGASSKA